MRTSIESAMLLIAGVAIGTLGPVAWDHMKSRHGLTDQPYAGQDQRAVSSLSDHDINELKAGHGWGLAKPAELNGYPGPAHVLELAAELELTGDQRRSVEATHSAMQEQAKSLGVALIAAEARLDEAFRSGGIDQKRLAERLASAEQIRAALRQAHLEAHLAIEPVLSDEQKQHYAQLRGYGGDHNHSH